MKLTDIFKFKLFERTDPVDMKTVNENFESVEKLFKGLDQVDNTSDCDKNVASAKKAECDGNGKNISETYLKKTAVANNNTTTEAGYALDARQANPNVDGSLAKQISTLNSGLTNKYFLKVLAKDWSGFVGTLFPQFNVQNDNVVDIYADKTDGTYPAVRVARASADYDGNNIPDTYLKKSDAKTMFNTGYRQVSSNEFNKYFSDTWSYAGADGLSIDSGTWLVNYYCWVSESSTVDVVSLKSTVDQAIGITAQTAETVARG